MNEPSVLDFLKSILRNRAAFQRFLAAVFERQDAVRAMEEASVESEPPEKAARPPAFDLRGFPWLILLVLLLALAAQATFEPPHQLYIVGIVLYLAALGLTILAYRRKQWSLAPLPAEESRAERFTIRALPLVVSIVLDCAAFLAMGDNRFTALNVTLWAGALLFHLWAFWLREPGPIKLPRLRLLEFVSRDEWTLRITRWGLAVLVVAAVSLFFRTHRLDAIAPEMTSDHAEKLMDVYDITQGAYSIYFQRNTGREPLYIYLCALVSGWFGFSFLTLKVVAVAGGLLTLPYIYLLGRELGSARLGLLAAAFAGFGYWPTVIERFGLRISFYPLFAAATLYYFLRGLRRQQRNDFILSGLALGLGLNGYTPFRIVPFVLAALFLVYLLHVRDANTRRQVFGWFVLLAFTSAILVIPLARFGIDRPDIFGERAFSRVGTTERPFPAPVWQLLITNLWTALKQFNWYNGNIWVHSVPLRPALDVVSGALFLIGAALVSIRYVRERHWKDLMLLLSVPLLQMPSILSLAFPEENPSMNRTGAALVPVFLLVGLGLDGLLNSFAGARSPAPAAAEREDPPRAGPSRAVLSFLVLIGLSAASFAQNYDLIFDQYYNQYRMSAWNSNEMGSVIRGFLEKGGPDENVWIVPYPYWLDTRIPAFVAGLPGRDLAIAPDNLAGTQTIPGAKLFLFIAQDEGTRQTLTDLYPQGSLTIFKAAVEHQNFYVFRVPAAP